MLHRSTFYLAFSALCLAAAPARADQVFRPFTVEVSLSEAALTQLKSIGEQVTIAAYYQGEPTPAAAKRQRSSEINLGNDSATYAPVPRKIMTVNGANFKYAQLASAQAGTITVLVNVYTARKAAATNLLSCDSFEGSFSQAAAQPLQISCKLIAE